jgi:small GTP-binding protein
MEKINVFIVGNSTVGKTSLLIRYDSGEFSGEKEKGRLGLDMIQTTFNPEGNPEGAKGEVLARVWDTAGQERFQAQTYSMMKTADGIILVFDKSSKESFDAIRHWK